MPRGISIKLDVTKLAREYFFHGKPRQDGSKSIYADLVLWENDEPDQFGNSFALQQSLPKEARQAGKKGNYCGSGNHIGTGRGQGAPTKGRNGNGAPPSKEEDWGSDFATPSQGSDEEYPF